MSCKPPYERGHGGYCGCNCKCLAPECWDLIYVTYDCNEGGSITPIGTGAISGEIDCVNGTKLCNGFSDIKDYCQNENTPCIGYDCQENGCIAAPYISGMYYTYNDCVKNCSIEGKYTKLLPREILNNGRPCPNGICPDDPTWICCADGVHCAATYADCPCVCNGKTGCTNPNSSNYDPDAVCDDGSCVTCLNAQKCVLDDRDGGANCNEIPPAGSLIDASSGGRCCDAYCIIAGDCHLSFSNSYTVPADKSCSGEEIVYGACNAQQTTTTTTTTIKPKICYGCIEGLYENNCQAVQLDLSPDDTATTCSDRNVPGETFYDSESECRASCNVTTPYPDYKICYYCPELYGVENKCVAVTIPYSDCSSYSTSYYNSWSECDAACQTTTTTTTTTTKPPCIVEVTTEGCCLEYSGGTIYAVGDGVVKAVAQDKENCCKDFRVLVNGKEETAQVQDGREVDLEPQSFYCPCEEKSKEPSQPSSASCPSGAPAAAPMIILDKKTNKIKILINKNAIRK